MLRLFEAHRDTEAARDYDAILATFAEDCSSRQCRSGCAGRERRAPEPRTRATSQPSLTSAPMTKAWRSGTTWWSSGERCGAQAAATGSAYPERSRLCRPVCQCRAVQGRPHGGGEHLLRSRDSLPAGEPRCRPGPGWRRRLGQRDKRDRRSSCCRACRREATASVQDRGEPRAAWLLIIAERHEIHRLDEPQPFLKAPPEEARTQGDK